MSATNKYSLVFAETQTKIFTTTIETDRDFDEICNEIVETIRREAFSEPGDVEYINGINILSIEEGAEELPEFELIDAYEVKT